MSDVLKGIISKVKKAQGIIKVIDFLVTGPIGTAVANLITKNIVRNPLAKPKFVGERHAVLSSSFGPVIANFAGPGTKVLERLRRGDLGVDPDKNGSFKNSLDTAARRHDILYSLAKDMPQIRLADELFIQDVKNSNQPTLLKKMIMGLFKLKMFGENVNLNIPGLLPLGAKLSKKNRDMLLDELKKTNVSLGN